MATIRRVRESNGDLRTLPIEITHLWCSRPGGYNDNYMVIPIKDHIGKKHLWQNPADYDRMIETYNRIKKLNE